MIEPAEPSAASAVPTGGVSWRAARRLIRSSALWLVLVAAAIGAAAGAMAVGLGQAAHAMQVLMFGIEPEVRLSAAVRVAPIRLILALPAGGVLLGLTGAIWARRNPKPPVDPVEANALRGGRLSARDSLFVALQTLISNGFGASVGLEAAYAQLGAGLGSRVGAQLNLRRADLRIMVGAGAGAAIAAAFGAPLTGAFYGFEVIIGSYTVASMAPVAVASLAAALVARAAGESVYGMAPEAFGGALTPQAYGLYALLGLAAAGFGVAVMRLSAVAEGLAARLIGRRWLRPVIGAILLAGLAMLSPQTLSSGHGALRADLSEGLGFRLILALIVLKAAASIISMGFGFRGGLFFASLFLGSLVGRAYGVMWGNWTPGLIDPTVASLVGMSALASAIIGAPLTMSFLALETTGDFGITAAALTASLFASVVVRETFGYSFSTWRLHLRGETIRSAHDVSWTRTLTAGAMMHPGVASIAAAATLAELRARHPLGSAKLVAILDPAGRYVGAAPLDAAFADQALDPARASAPASSLAINARDVLSPDMTIKEIMEAFDRSEADELVVVDGSGAPMGVLSEAYATRRYAEELEKAHRDLTGEG
ncbi:MAG TPA: chloride channel protein [Caulobacteraceae bacterium]|nr:chloride channel protein [Caulobacteraceae bacterium]